MVWKNSQNGGEIFIASPPYGGELAPPLFSRWGGNFHTWFPPHNGMEIGCKVLVWDVTFGESKRNEICVYKACTNVNTVHKSLQLTCLSIILWILKFRNSILVWNSFQGFNSLDFQICLSEYFKNFRLRRKYSRNWSPLKLPWNFSPATLNIHEIDTHT